MAFVADEIWLALGMDGPLGYHRVRLGILLEYAPSPLRFELDSGRHSIVVWQQLRVEITSWLQCSFLCCLLYPFNILLQVTRLRSRSQL